MVKRLVAVLLRRIHTLLMQSSFSLDVSFCSQSPGVFHVDNAETGTDTHTHTHVLACPLHIPTDV